MQQCFLDMLGDEEEEGQPMKRQRQDDDFGYQRAGGGYGGSHMASHDSQQQSSHLFQQFSRPSGQQQHVPAAYGHQGNPGMSNVPTMGYMQPQAPQINQGQGATQQSFQQLASMIRSHPQPQVRWGDKKPLSDMQPGFSPMTKDQFDSLAAILRCAGMGWDYLLLG